MKRSILHWKISAPLPLATMFCAGLTLAGCGGGSNSTKSTSSSSDAGTEAAACPGQLDCSGTCVDSANDPQNCGACGNACGAGKVCSSGTCSSTCGSSQTLCTSQGSGAYCANTDSDNQNCGACGNACAAGQVCSAGKCSSTCGSSQTLCTPEAGAAYCANTDSDNQNCGACGNACATGQVCVSGSCATSCPGSEIDCGGNCIDPNTSSTHCGASGDCTSPNAGTACSATQQCVSGACKAVKCTKNADCSDGLYCNGTETCNPTSPSANAFGCVAGTYPCSNSYETCNEGTKTCSCTIDQDKDGLTSALCGGTDCDDNLYGYGTNDWADCGTCGTKCAVQQACQAGKCVAARRVFVSNTGYNGNFGGVAGADADCQGLADAAGLGGTWKAYIFDPSHGLGRMTHATVPYVRLDGVKVANNWTDLTDLSILAPINITEQRQRVTGDAWTGLYGSGTVAVSSQTCNSWTTASSSVVAEAGLVGHVDANWQGIWLHPCSRNYYRLYCIEQ